ncbi:MAG TPA: beta-phosphoglucomutase family hydrolase [Acidimicrobiia bacterium]|nr:beta-phosphoglucomutase family hydrolase [Acidimicrobiia bacterium]
MLSVEAGSVVLDTGSCLAVIFDMDGVVTDSASAHRRAWKRTFDSFLDERYLAGGERMREFDEADYLTYVDGKPRYDGVRSFLASRGIELPEGTPEDPPEAETVNGLGNRKNQAFLQTVAESGIDPYPSTLELIDRLHSGGVGVALITSSRNAGAVLEAAGVDVATFDHVVDGTESARLGLAGKPDPAIFLEAASRLGASAAGCVVVEDAVSGVEAGRAGEFGGVIGVDRGNNREALRAAGADVVVEDLAEVTLG